MATNKKKKGKKKKAKGQQSRKLYLASLLGALLIGIFNDAMWAFVSLPFYHIFPTLKSETSSVFTERDSAINEVQARGLSLHPRLWRKAFNENDQRLIQLLTVIELNVDANDHDELWRHAVRQRSNSLIMFLQKNNIKHSANALCKLSKKEQIGFLLKLNTYSDSICEHGTIIDTLIMDSIRDPRRFNSAEEYPDPTWVQHIDFYRMNPKTVTINSDSLKEYENYLNYVFTEIGDYKTRTQNIKNFCLENINTDKLVVFDLTNYDGVYKPKPRNFGSKLTYFGTMKIRTSGSGGYTQTIGRRTTSVSGACRRKSSTEKPNKCLQTCIRDNGISLFNPQNTAPNCAVRVSDDDESTNYTANCKSKDKRWRDDKWEEYTKGFWYACEEMKAPAREKICSTTVSGFQTDFQALEYYQDYIQRLKGYIDKITK